LTTNRHRRSAAVKTLEGRKSMLEMLVR